MWKAIQRKWRRFKRTVLLVIVSAILILCLACGGLVLLANRALADASSPPLDVMLLLDNSNSMWDKGGIGSDPDLLRVQAANLFILYLGVDAQVTGNRLGIIHFGTTSELVVPLTPLDDAQQRATIGERIAHPQRMGWTDPLQALELAYDELFLSGRGDPAHQPVVILLTDGKPELETNPTPQEKAAYIEALRARVELFRQQNCPIFTVVLSNEATDADPDIQTVYRNLWQEIAARTPPASYHEARTAEDLLRIYHDIVACLMGAQVSEPVIETKVEGSVTATISIEEGLARMTLVALKSEPSITVHILRPGGAAVRADDPDVHHVGRGHEEVWAIVAPRPGDWTVELNGWGTIIVWKDVIPEPVPAPAPTFTLELREPPAYVLAGQPLEIIVAVLDSEGRPVSDPTLQMVAELRRANFLETTLLCRDDGTSGDATPRDGLYTARYLDPVPGAYTVHLRALRAGQEIACWEGAIEIVPRPRLEIVAPAAGATFPAGQSPIVRLRVTDGYRFLDGVTVKARGPLTVTLTEPGGIVYPLPLNAEASGCFSATVPTLTAVGTYTISARLSGQTSEGLDFIAEAQRTFAVLLPVPASTPQLPSRRKNGWLWALGGALGVIALGSGGLALAIHRRRPRLEGQLRVLAAPEGQTAGQVIELPANRRTATLGKTTDDVPLAGNQTLAIIRAQKGEEGETEMELVPLHPDQAVLAVNEGLLTSPRPLKDGDVITAGDYRLRYENLRRASSRQLGHSLLRRNSLGDRH